MASKATRSSAASPLHQVTAKFKGDVISLHVFFGGHEIPMSQNGPEWKGKKAYDVAGTVRGELDFKAPAKTDYEFELKVDGVKKVELEGTSKAPPFSRGYEVVV